MRWTREGWQCFLREIPDAIKTHSRISNLNTRAETDWSYFSNTAALSSSPFSTPVELGQANQLSVLIRGLNRLCCLYQRKVNSYATTLLIPYSTQRCCPVRHRSSDLQKGTILQNKDLRLLWFSQLQALVIKTAWMKAKCLRANVSTPPRLSLRKTQGRL